MPNPLLGVFFHWLGGLASASFYVPFRGVRGWSWEIFWLVGGLFSWILAPWLFAALRTHDLLAVLAEAPLATLALCYFFGALWGFGGLTFGLTMRYLGISLGTAIALGLTAAFGTLIPPLVSGQLFGSTDPLDWRARRARLAWRRHSLGIAIVGKAGHAKEFEQAALLEMASGGCSDLPRAADFRKGVGVAVFSGIMSSCFAYGLAAGEPLRQLTLAHGTPALAQGLPVLVVVLLGGFTTNAVWCLILILKNRSARELVGELKVAGADLVPSTGRNYSPVRARGYGLVLPVLLLHHGREPDGPLPLFELDPPHVQHHYFRGALGPRPAGVAWREPAQPGPSDGGAPGVGGFHRGHWFGKRPRGAELRL